PTRSGATAAETLMIRFEPTAGEQDRNHPSLCQCRSIVAARRRMEVSMLRILLSVLCMLLAAPARAQPSLPLESIRLPPGFSIELVARVENAREMALGAKGTLFVGSMQAGKVYAVRLSPGAPAEVLTVASGLRLPVGVAFRDGALYVSAVDRILRLDD